MRVECNYVVLSVFITSLLSIVIASFRFNFSAWTQYNNGQHDSSSETTTNNTIAKKFIRFHEMDVRSMRRALSGEKLLRTSYEDATVVEQAPGWFPFTQICHETCCATAVAISLYQEEYHLVNTMTGTELADTSIPHYPSKDLLFHSQPPFLTEDLVPCLQPGTIIQMDNHATISNYFWKKLRPNITVPFAIITSESDGDTPDDRYSKFAKKLQSDNLLLKWYGTNPDYKVVDHYKGGRDKFVPLILGLSRQHKQEPYLQYFLQKNQYQNPFEEKSRWINAFLGKSGWSKSLLPSFLFGNNKPDAPDNWLFVNFNIHNEFARHRGSVYRRLCKGFEATNTTELSCRPATDKSKVPPDILYAKASEYLFGVSPPGVGWDCYRTYELLLLGVIPIVDGSRSGSRELFEGLPVIFVENLKTGGVTGSWSRRSIYQQAKEYILGQEFQNANFTIGWNKLFTKHWRRKILKDTGRQIVQDENGQEYVKVWRYTRRESQGEYLL